MQKLPSAYSRDSGDTLRVSPGPSSGRYQIRNCTIDLHSPYTVTKLRFIHNGKNKIPNTYHLLRMTNIFE
jgi:hypothetical protein